MLGKGRLGRKSVKQKGFRKGVTQMRQRNLLFIMILVGMMSSVTLAISPMGPAPSPLGQGQNAVGAGVAMTRQPLEVSGPLGPATGTGGAELGDFRNFIYNVSIGHGISDT